MTFKSSLVASYTIVLGLFMWEPKEGLSGHVLEQPDDHCL